MTVLVFDIETVPDVAGIRLLEELPAELSDHEVAEFGFQQRRATNGSDFLPHHLHRVVTISCVLRDARQFRVFSLSEPDAGEGEIVQRFFDGLERFTPHGALDDLRFPEKRFDLLDLLEGERRSPGSEKAGTSEVPEEYQERKGACHHL